MEEVAPLRVVAADRLDGSVIITFNDGACGVYSSELLHAMLASARQLREADSDEAKAPDGN